MRTLIYIVVTATLFTLFTSGPISAGKPKGGDKLAPTVENSDTVSTPIDKKSFEGTLEDFEKYLKDNNLYSEEVESEIKAIRNLIKDKELNQAYAELRGLINKYTSLNSGLSNSLASLNRVLSLLEKDEENLTAQLHADTLRLEHNDSILDAQEAAIAFIQSYKSEMLAQLEDSAKRIIEEPLSDIYADRTNIENFLSQLGEDSILYNRLDSILNTALFVRDQWAQIITVSYDSTTIGRYNNYLSNAAKSNYFTKEQKDEIRAYQDSIKAYDAIIAQVDSVIEKAYHFCFIENSYNKVNYKAWSGIIGDINIFETTLQPYPWLYVIWKEHIRQDFEKSAAAAWAMYKDFPTIHGADDGGKTDGGKTDGGKTGRRGSSRKK